MEISFYGPFVHELRTDTVVISAPRCEGHLAYVQTDDLERALEGCLADRKDPCQYELQDEKGNVHFYCGSANPGNGINIITVDTGRKAEKDGPDLPDCHFQLVVPRPDYISGAIPDPLKFIEYDLPDPPHQDDHFATAMRFHYCNIPQGTKLGLCQVIGPHKGDSLEIDVTATTPKTHVPLMLHYGGSGIFDEDHQDAEDCFMRMRALVPPLGAWKPDFNPKIKIVKRGGDCKAAQIMFQSRDDMSRWRNRFEELRKSGLFGVKD